MFPPARSLAPRATAGHRGHAPPGPRGHAAGGRPLRRAWPAEGAAEVLARGPARRASHHRVLAVPAAEARASQARVLAVFTRRTLTWHRLFYTNTFSNFSKTRQTSYDESK